ncbi:glycerophosphoryl diester phosphodiesterase [Ignatzschineria indica]|uniref:Glycerophosphodiester phosphodiesterase n=2 Tax=Ignatzschineria TaxID=112008 RepID=A0A2U2AQX1_9GAMM|nr:MULTISPECIES: glycerophosphodiester phosphodiesterase family protein [Ignatzschineria]PWD82572.1 glycerophosphodiester phosphodiesterase [Ignatzschineria indica]PWD86287.1 glycerophosphodiester phosphodiesterase [Ignatzschineria cameli]PWD89875.1 glycerophosphodiester phosphodiesterase [Ignatzschineria cameli]PWD91525.1 glycerophosphodiester phosphodiesterase [Ignatzschineria cameli]PWD92563.1 glycerophosphodiester phosphodiesterase [Ignatzschineria cameli]
MIRVEKETTPHTLTNPNASPYPTLIAHRGAGKEAPENTLTAFRYGSQQGFTMFECDVKLSQDQELFLLHDTTLMRTTNGKGSAYEYSWDALSRLDAGSWHSAQYSGEPLARFESLINFILNNHYLLDVEIKPNPGEAYKTGVATASFLQKKIIEYRSQILDLPQPPFLLSSFAPEALQGAKEIAPEIPRALLVNDWSQGEATIFEQISQLSCSGIILNYQIVSSEIIEKVHQMGGFIMVYTANECLQINKLLKMGVDSVITDNMDLYNMDLSL